MHLCEADGMSDYSGTFHKKQFVLVRSLWRGTSETVRLIFTTLNPFLRPKPQSHSCKFWTGINRRKMSKMEHLNVFISSVLFFLSLFTTLNPIPTLLQPQTTITLLVNFVLILTLFAIGKEREKRIRSFILTTPNKRTNQLNI
jgi:hypothetical protein